MDPAVRVPGSGGLVATNALTTAAPIQPHREPSARRFVVQYDGVANRVRERARGETGERQSAISGDRCAGNVDRVRIATS
jgi:hypothetical protein